MLTYLVLFLTFMNYERHDRETPLSNMKSSSRYRALCLEITLVECVTITLLLFPYVCKTSMFTSKRGNCISVPESSNRDAQHLIRYNDCVLTHGDNMLQDARFSIDQDIYVTGPEEQVSRILGSRYPTLPYFEYYT